MNKLVPLLAEPALAIAQRKELIELVGFEARNKYSIETTSGRALYYAAEQGKSVADALLRYFVGHFRPFEIVLFDTMRVPVARAVHPFRLFLQRLEIYDDQGRRIGELRQRLSLLQRRFDVLDEQGQVLFSMRSPLFRFWTYRLFRGASQIALIEKKWSGLLKEAFLDADRFLLTFGESRLTPNERLLMLFAALFVDLLYFEKKAS